jgi:hypothetical protein
VAGRSVLTILAIGLTALALVVGAALVGAALPGGGAGAGPVAVPASAHWIGRTGPQGR